MAQAEQQLAQARQGVFESATRARDALEIWLATDKEALKLAEKEKATRRNAWDRVIPFFAFPPAVRKVIYTTNAIENINAQLRKIIKTR
ncbi:MAG: transposase, partial [Azoarcus sp.]|nr:transposase [Azoarcus sp.]